jgi:hypothetical protein
MGGVACHVSVFRCSRNCIGLSFVYTSETSRVLNETRFKNYIFFNLHSMIQFWYGLQKR